MANGYEHTGVQYVYKGLKDGGHFKTIADAKNRAYDSRAKREHLPCEPYSGYVR